MGKGHFLSEAQFPTRRKGKSFTNLAEQPFLSQNSLPSVFFVQAEVKLVAVSWLTQIVFNSLGWDLQLFSLCLDPFSASSFSEPRPSTSLLSHIYYLAPQQDTSCFCRPPYRQGKRHGPAISLTDLQLEQPKHPGISPGLPGIYPILKP